MFKQKKCVAIFKVRLTYFLLRYSGNFGQKKSMAIEHLKNEYLAKTYMNRESMTPKLEVMFTVITIFSKLRQKKSVFVASFFVLHSGKAMTKNDY